MSFCYIPRSNGKTQVMTLCAAPKKLERSIVPSFKLQQACEGKTPCQLRPQIEQRIYSSEQETRSPQL
jgi:hypothetical protein